MTNRDKEIITKLFLGKISEADGLKEMNLTESMIEDYTLASLNDDYNLRDSDGIDFELYFGYGKTCSERFINVLCKLIVEDWHVSHENIALLLQTIKSPRSIDCLQDVIFVAGNLDYFPDNGAALIRKCCFALGDINTARSRSILKDLLMSDNELIKRAALEQTEIKRTVPNS